MKKPSLTKEQNLQLKNLNLEEKLDLLHKWKKDGDISHDTFVYFSNLWIRKESKKIINNISPLRHYPDENYGSICRSVVESDIREFTFNLRNRLNAYLSRRSGKYSLSLTDMNKFKKFASDNSYRYRTLTNKLIILGLRFPDKDLNQFCDRFIEQNKKNKAFFDSSFWVLLWQDEDFVPVNAVRFMLKKKGEEYHIDDYFSPYFIKSMLPLFKAQRDKEAVRLQWAQSLEGEERENEVKRKMRRLNAFNLLIEAAQNY